ncbi:TCR/Tet family MFS transporter [Lacihabitans sp. CS3-21]|uniref:TCR/Tet family MFS transporter n=1 Tax=Lacihabitans sp. CS3-21 TaxID=2487332 RepID=UPI000BC78A61|nr:TCR/Tet family MFS transporter [Lacihabitans sp. CS3-21]MCP9748731.1 MFS transporter [Lacihabitans sp. CS3-21]OYU64612.1 MAG: tetracycline resistance MFS efflux pump [Cytophagaceae bacterium BCCC1]
MSEKKNSKAIFFILVTVLIDVIGIGIIIPIMPSLYQELTGGTVSEASQYSAYLVFIYALMQFIFSPIIGGLSDQYGRRPVLLMSLFGFGLDFIFLALAPSIGWLFVGRIISGIAGASFTTANAYIADITEPEKRAQSFGMIGAAFGLGFIIGPSLGGILGEYGTRIPFWVSAGLAILNWLYGYFILPESLLPENRRKFDIKRANPIGSLLNLKKYPYVLALVLSLFLVNVSNFATQGTWSFYGIEKFSWSKLEVGLSLGFVGLMVAIVQGGLIRVIIPKIGQERSLFLGLAINALGLAAFAFASSSWMMYAIMIPFAIGGLAGPAFQGIISNQVGKNEQGELQGGLTSLMSIAAIVGQPLMLGLFRIFTKENAPIYFPGAPFLMGGLLSLISLLLVFRTIKKENLKD